MDTPPAAGHEPAHSSKLVAVVDHVAAAAIVDHLPESATQEVVGFQVTSYAPVTDTVCLREPVPELLDVIAIWDVPPLSV